MKRSTLPRSTFASCCTSFEQTQEKLTEHFEALNGRSTKPVIDEL